MPLISGTIGLRQRQRLGNKHPESMQRELTITTYEMKTPIAAGLTEIVKILLDARADPNATMKDGMSASELAEKMHHPEALELLKSRRPIQKD